LIIVSVGKLTSVVYTAPIKMIDKNIWTLWRHR